MKIQQVSPNDALTRAAPAAPHAAEQGASSAVLFSRVMSGLTGDARAAQLQAMLASIDEQGRRLGERVDVTEYMRYRKLLTEFLNDLLSNGYEFNKENAYGAKGRRRYIVTVKTLDEKLDELGKEILNGEADNLSVLAAIDEIRGLLVDIFV